MSDKICIEGLEKAKVLAALYNGARPQGMGFLQYDPAPMTEEEAEGILDQGAYFDYLKGRVMKVDLSESSFDPRWYDHDNGEGAAGLVIEALRSTGEANAELVKALHITGRHDAAE